MSPTKQNIQTSKQIIAPMFVDDYISVLKSFNHQISYTPPSSAPQLPPDTATKAVVKHFSSLPIATEQLKKVLFLAKQSALLSNMAYPFHPGPLKNSIAVYTTYILAIDDLGHTFFSDLKSFSSLITSDKAQTHPLLTSFLNFLPTLESQFGPYAYSSILSSVLDFISVCVLEISCDGKVTPPPTAPSFPRYLRQKSGGTEVYSHFLFDQLSLPEDEHLQTYLYALPAMSRFIDHSNDVLSFYKESIVGEEKFNFIWNCANSNGMEVTEALKCTSEVAVESYKEVRNILKSCPVALVRWDMFVGGLLGFHWTQERYFLSELDILEED